MELNSEKLTILLDHMLHHNKHHSDEIGEIAENAEKMDKANIAALIQEAKALQDQANEKLEAALEMAKKEE
ncbi:MAG: hypothetical protein ACOX8R_01110 [Bacillota bacterium]|jgi:hypothetical protein